MSVINQALKDLQRRQPQAPGRARSVYQAPRQTRWPVWLAVALGGLAGALLTYYMLAHASSEETSSPQTVELIMPQRESPDSKQDTEYPSGGTLAVVHTREIAVRDDASTERGEDTDAATNVIKNDSSGTSLLLSQAQAANTSATEGLVEVRSAPVKEASEPTSSDRGSMRIERVERSAEELAQQRLEQAIAAQDSGQGRRAESLLQEALVLRPDFIDARQRLAAHYYGRGYSGQALRVLEEGLLHTPGHPRLLSLAARIHEEAGEPSAALDMLNRLNVELPDNSELVVLRAALANEIDRFEVAAEDYRALLRMNPNRGLWWLGLGYAEEGLGHGEAAYSAYERALEDSSLNRESREFARTRMEALSTW